MQELGLFAVVPFQKADQTSKKPHNTILLIFYNIHSNGFINSWKQKYISDTIITKYQLDANTFKQKFKPKLNHKSNFKL